MYVCGRKKAPGLSVSIESVDTQLDLGVDSTGDVQLATVERRRYHLRVSGRRRRAVGQYLERYGRVKQPREPVAEACEGVDIKQSDECLIDEFEG